MMGAHFDLDLGDPGQSGVYRIAPEALDTMAALARDAGLRVLRVDLAGCASKRTLLARLGTQLDFPHGSGMNWDALSDNLRDLSWLPAQGYAVLLEAVDALRAGAGEDFHFLLDILDEAAVAWANEGVPFVAFVSLQEEEDAG
ncbi:barnase inhibitor [Stenotrophomonas panacihumi]|uniref:Barnase inhibitor n=1 Tax=Stenotrophomonas panacihumi TaxID=676599 RepID=A0A0R0B083_9GAMM|nr:barstar family protein [Stenotrophomonas panacihumi]KRG46339.1 barnase inhibitor [Stenotrophomonas panacihumi]PTN54721.1 barnase inhibitor [Stenotrophomonas panacihumi]